MKPWGEKEKLDENRPCSLGFDIDAVSSHWQANGFSCVDSHLDDYAEVAVVRLKDDSDALVAAVADGVSGSGMGFLAAYTITKLFQACALRVLERGASEPVGKCAFPESLSDCLRETHESLKSTINEFLQKASDVYEEVEALKVALNRVKKIREDASKQPTFQPLGKFVSELKGVEDAFQNLDEIAREEIRRQMDSFLRRIEHAAQGAQVKVNGKESIEQALKILEAKLELGEFGASNSLDNLDPASTFLGLVAFKNDIFIFKAGDSNFALSFSEEFIHLNNELSSGLRSFFSLRNGLQGLKTFWIDPADLQEIHLHTDGAIPHYHEPGGFPWILFYNTRKGGLEDFPRKWFNVLNKRKAINDDYTLLVISRNVPREEGREHRPLSGAASALSKN